MIELRSVLPPGVSPNGAPVRTRAGKLTRSRHWSHKARGAALLRASARSAAMVYARDVRYERARISVTLRVCRDPRVAALSPAYRPTDEDNLLAACKGFLDGLVDAGIVPDDSSAHIEIGRARFELVSAARDEGLFVLVEDLGEE